MTTPSHSLQLRRLALKHALRTLSPTSFRMLLHLATDACEDTARVWTTPLRLAEDIGSPASLVSETLDLLVERKHMKLWSRSHAALRCYELGPLFVRRSEAPENLPVEPLP
ncbi:MAG: hypothetical protein JWM10_3055 [Myxococcaceae bacterium]|nr:hypothetical protein [Myxococcaceae bacterium]